MIELKRMSCCIALGTIHADEIQNFVHILMDNGIYADVFLDIIDSEPATIVEVLPPFTSYLEEKGIFIPSKEEAVKQLASYCLSRIVLDKADPISETEQFIQDVEWDNILELSGTDDNTLAAKELLALYSDYEDMSERYPYNKLPDKEIDSFRHEIFEYAQRYINEVTLR